MASNATNVSKVANELPPEGAFRYEPKWDGFRAIVFRGDGVFIRSRDLRPFDATSPICTMRSSRRCRRGACSTGRTRNASRATATGVRTNATKRLAPVLVTAT